MGSELGVNTRRYHGLLITATRPPVVRIMALQSLAETLEIGTADRKPGREQKPLHVDLWTQYFNDPPELSPSGFEQLSTFERLSPTTVCWTYHVHGFTILKTLQLLPGEPAVRIRYDIEEAPAHARLRLRPLTPLRGFHELCRQSADKQPEVIPCRRSSDKHSILIRRDGVQLAMSFSTGRFTPEPTWWHGFAYPADRDRGQEWLEDLWSPGSLELAISPTEPTTLTITATTLETPATARAMTQIDPTAIAPLQRLQEAAQQFVVERNDQQQAGHSIIAGYPWFADWGRDSMICIPGLLLSQGHLGQAKSVLNTFSRHLRGGLIPNRFDDYGQTPHYNAVDASLWFLHAVYLLYRQDADALDEGLLNTCRQIIHAYQQGTEFDIAVDDDGLVKAGHPDIQLTWMDAQRDGVTFTARHGKAVEINALWFNGLMAVAEMSNQPEEQQRLTEAADQAATSFRSLFWWPARGCCHDVVHPQDGQWKPDQRLRPNQIFAVSLPFSPLEKHQQRSVVEVVGERLLTPMGLRTLDPDDSAYQGRFEGDMYQRDAAYHQGTVWPWLMGHFVDAWLRVHGDSPAQQATALKFITPLLGELDRGCVGQIAEVYDGDPPHRGAGCPAQAWSVAELLRVLARVSDEATLPA